MLRIVSGIFTLVLGFHLNLHDGLGVGGDAVAAEVSAAKSEVALFAGGCFWCVQPIFDKLPGVISTEVGYIGGTSKSATYDQVSTGGTGHAEAIKVVFNPAKVSYEQLLDLFWRNIDPLDEGGQFCDRGEQYRATIYYQDERQKESARLSKLDVEKRLGQKTVTPIIPAMEFFAGEEYHQLFYQKKPEHYKRYRKGCGRDQRLEEVWGKATEAN